MADSHPPPPDLDVPAARAAAALYRAGLARGLPEHAAWEEASTLFSLSHPSWPLPMAEREAARTVGALIARDWTRGTVLSRTAPPAALVRRLAAPVTPDSNAPPDDGPHARMTSRPTSPVHAPRRDRPPAPVAPFLAMAPHRAALGASPC